MADIEIQRDATGETMVFQVEGLTEPGSDFIDGYMPPGNAAAGIFVVDSGRIILPETNEKHFRSEARERGLTIAQAEAEGG